MTPLETYLARLSEIRSSGEAVNETSYYGALESLFNEIGKSLKPKISCVLQLRNRGAGMPDGGLFTEEQLKRKKYEDPDIPQKPSRGVIEIKSTSDDAWLTADSAQVSRYWSKYGQVLVTNYRDFVFVGKDSAGNPVKLETFRLANDEPAFWRAAAHPRKTADLLGATFLDFTKRAMRHAAPLSDPADVAWFLASYARDALARIGLHELPALAVIRKALEEALGLRFEGEKGEHFFKSTLVQTLFYGVFSAWVLWSKQNPARAALAQNANQPVISTGVREGRNLSSSSPLFDWKHTAFNLRIPILQKLFHEIANPAQLERLNLSEILDWTSSVLNRVDRPVFFDRFQEAHAVQYFYEPFLQNFDPDLRKQLGVWYTPPEIVKYMVARVDTVLREELDLPDGLADKNVYVLDPCCGTGSYLVEVLNKIHETLKSRGSDALIAADLNEAAQKRVFGFELLPAPFVVSHLQLGLLLQNLGAPLSEKKKERIRVYLTNALTGWEPPKEPKTRLLYPELEEERDAAEHVKRSTPILVILGNPPYNAFAGVSPSEEQGLVEPYKEGLVKVWKIKKFNLDDLYVRFFRLAERRIAEMSGRGVVSFISNHSWISDPSFVVLRKHLSDSFDRFWIENMHGNRKISEYAPDGRTSETVFAIPGFSAGIRQGVAVSLWIKRGKEKTGTSVLFRDDINEASAVERRAHLLRTLNEKRFDAHYMSALPEKNNRYSFRPQEVGRVYRSWPQLTDLCWNPPINGLMEKRGGALISYNRSDLEARMRAYYDPGVEWDPLKLISPGLTSNAGRFDAKKARKKVQEAEALSAARIVRYALRPFDNRWAYYSSVRPLWNEPRPQLWRQYSGGNKFLMSRPAGVARPEGAPFFFTRNLGDNDFLRGHAYYIPFEEKPAPRRVTKREAMQPELLLESRPAASEQRPNLCATMELYALELDIAWAPELADTIWMHALAIGYSPLLASADLGRQVAADLDTESPINGVTLGQIRLELKTIAVPRRAGGGNITEFDRSLKAGWGHAGKGGVTMPGKGKLFPRPYSPDERKALLEGAQALGLSEKQLFACLGEKTCDVYLNGVAYWANIPSRVWDYTIGGYQVIKKWLSYREEPLLGRPLTLDEVRYVQEMARRIAAILLLEPALDANYESIKQHTYPWPPKEDDK